MALGTLLCLVFHFALMQNYDCGKQARKRAEWIPENELFTMKRQKDGGCGEYNVDSKSTSGTLIVDLLDKTNIPNRNTPNFRMNKFIYKPDANQIQERSGENLYCGRKHNINEVAGYLCITKRGKLKRNTNFVPRIGSKFELTVKFNDLSGTTITCIVNIYVVKFLPGGTSSTLAAFSVMISSSRSTTFLSPSLSASPVIFSPLTAMISSSSIEAQAKLITASFSKRMADILTTSITETTTAVPDVMKTTRITATASTFLLTKLSSPQPLSSASFISGMTLSSNRLTHNKLLTSVTSGNSWSCTKIDSPHGVSSGNRSQEQRQVMLNDLKNVGMTTSNACYASSMLTDLTNDNPETLNHQELKSISDILQSLLPFVGNTDNVANYMIQTLDNFLKSEEDEIFKSQRQFKTSSRILNIIGALGEQIIIHQKEDFSEAKDEFALAATRENSSSFSGMTVIYTTAQSVNNKNKLQIHRNNSVLRNGNRHFIETYISLPKQIASKIKQSNFILVFAVYNHGKLFQNRRADSLNSKVISAEVRHEKIVELSEPIITNFQNIKMKRNQPLCSWWDVSKKGKWSEDGCHSFENDNQFTTCHCKHLTNFAVLLGANEPSENHRWALSVITNIGCAISLIGSLATILTYGLFRELRKSDPPKILLNLCIAYVMMLLVFLVGVTRTESTKGCQAMAVLLQYFLMCVFTWCAVEGFASFRGIVCPMEAEIENFIWKAVAFAWGAPIIFPILGISIWPESYGDQRSCVVRGKPFYITLLAPVVLVLVMNYVALISIVCDINKSSESYKQHALALTDRVRIIAVFAFLFGLTWTFGFLVVSNDIAAFQYLFCISSGIHGLFIFLYYVVRSKNAKQLWFSKLGIKSLQRKITSEISVNPAQKKIKSSPYIDSTSTHPKTTNL